MQPIKLSVVTKQGRDTKYHDSSQDIQRIEKVQVEQYDWNYVGYNFDNKKLFEYHWRSVNVHYFTD